MSIKLLFVGDIHLGARPSRIPDDLQHHIRELSPSQAWRQTVEYAIEQRVVAVILAGDVVEKENDFFEAYRDLEQGVEKLLHHNIRIIAVAGNHDVKVLPRLADQLPGFELLGRNGEWQQTIIQKDQEIVQLFGWSFPDKTVTFNPIQSLPAHDKSLLTLGVLHCDLDQFQSVYAPVSSRDLAMTGFDAWFLGHVHKPSPLNILKPIGYLGSLSGTDPGESGKRGPWLAEIHSGVLTSLVQAPLAPIQWQPFIVDVTGLNSKEEIKDKILLSLRDLDQKLSNQEYLKAVGLRMLLQGRSDLRDLKIVLNEEEKKHIFLGQGKRHYFVEKVIVDVKPAIDIGNMAKQDSPIGVLARKILLLESDEEHDEKRSLIMDAKDKLNEFHNLRWPQRPIQLDDQDVLRYLKKSSWSVLNHLLQQQEG